ncbi:MAG: prolipoprotein diacylglyceryl transferase [Bryobacterales bacterium]|jgi:phosphatidylglycerol:prolipoprotein diacylglycerol transferase|nr:prolipoprotein diacylglyceryl transferase [Bryobacterales bacterium]
MHPKLLEFGNFFLPSYGLFVALGFLVGMMVTRALANRRGLDSEFIVGAALYTALVGLAGAKLALILQDFSYYSRNPEQLFSLNMLQSAGIFYGGVIAGLLFFVWYFQKHRMPIAASADCLAPGLAIGHALGRLGCFFGGCCFGEVCDRPWAVTYTNAAVRDFSNVPLGVPLHPTQLYEAATEFTVFLILWLAFGRLSQPGRILGLFLVLSSTGRFVVEFFRAHDAASPFGWALSTAQWTALALIVLGVWLLQRRPTR